MKSEVKMRVVSDSNILSIKSCLGDSAELRLIPGREISRKDLLNADVLLVRSITRVDKELLQGTPVRFVGSATSGTDHVDLEYLRVSGIHFVDARGSNANAVVDYCFAALAFAVMHRDLRLDRCVVGLIGAGYVGGLFAQKLDKLGIRYRVCDPPLHDLMAADNLSSPVCRAATEPDTQFPERSVPPNSRFCTFNEVLSCDVISLHVPLVRGGAYSTYKLLGEHELRQLKPNATLINTSRGSVIYEPALIEKLRSSEAMTCIMDVWDNEPEVAAELVNLVDVATPHIAGYSQDAKQAATNMLLVELSAFFGLSESGSQQPTAASRPEVESPSSAPNAHWSCLLNLLPLLKLSGDFKHSVRQGNSAVQFDAMRKRLLNRREFKNFQIAEAALTAEQKSFLRVLGLQFIQDLR